MTQKSEPKCNGGEERFHGIAEHRMLCSSLALTAGTFVLTAAPLDFRYFHVFIAVYATILLASMWFCAGAPAPQWHFFKDSASFP